MHPSEPTPNQIKRAEATRKREVVRAFMEERQLSQSTLARLCGMSKPSVSRALHDEPASHTRTLQKLHNLATKMPGGDLGEALHAINRFASTSTCFDISATAQLLRAIANMLDPEG